jgi:hypothetical protein
VFPVQVRFIRIIHRLHLAKKASIA